MNQSRKLIISFILILNIILLISNEIRAAPRLSLTEWQSYDERGNGDGNGQQAPETYRFGYDIDEPDNTQFRHEERHANGTVSGSYGYVTPDGNVHIIHYVADHLGYRASIETRKRGILKPIAVNVEQDITNAINDGFNNIRAAGKYTVRNNIAYRNY